MAVTPAATSSTVEDRVIDIVAGLVTELAGTDVGRPTLDDSLDRELGITSLERVELRLRLEQAFGVRLPDSVMAEAATPQDLVTAILHAAPPVAGLTKTANPRTPQREEAASSLRRNFARRQRGTSQPWLSHTSPTNATTDAKSSVG